MTSHAYEVEAARAYRDRLVLKLRGIENPSDGAALRGRTVLAPAVEVPALPKNQYFAVTLVGSSVQIEGTTEQLGTVADVVETAGTDVLVVTGREGHEMLIPMAEEIVVEIRESEGMISVRLPEGLRELNRAKDEC